MLPVSYGMEVSPIGMDNTCTGMKAAISDMKPAAPVRQS